MHKRGNGEVILKFTAVEEGSSVKDELVETVGISSGDEYLLFGRSNGEADDWGVYLEYSDQINAGYKCIDQCVISEKVLEIKLSKQLGQLEGVDGFFIHLELDDSEYNDLLHGLKHLCRGEGILNEANA
jgi:hypothetical protein